MDLSLYFIDEPRKECTFLVSMIFIPLYWGLRNKIKLWILGTGVVEWWFKFNTKKYGSNFKRIYFFYFFYILKNVRYKWAMFWVVKNLAMEIFTWISKSPKSNLTPKGPLSLWRTN